MRIALFSSDIEPTNGYGTIAHELCAAFHRRGVDFTLFLPKHLATYCRNSALPFRTCCVLPKYIHRIYQPTGLRYFFPIDVRSYDLVHSLFDFPYCLHACISAKWRRKPFMMGAQGTYGVRPLMFLPERWLLKWCYRSAQSVTVPSHFTRDKIQEYAKEQYPIEIIHNGVNIARFQKKLDLTALQKQYTGRKILITIGALIGRKGHDLVLRALARIVPEEPRILYLIIGEGNTRKPLEALVDELHLQNHVEFCGERTGDDLVALLQIADIYVHTPKYAHGKFEGFGIVYLEAGACGKPVIATDAGGVRDAIINGQTGVIVPDNDIPGIAGAIRELLRDPEKARRLGEQGRLYAQEHDWEIIVEKFLELYHVCSLRSPEPPGSSAARCGSDSSGKREPRWRRASA
ncbi:hypothetical protein A3E47_01315 [Candidatus Peribacteria bacterium RIFCSPHIGHO2_12_FULL_54_10]|nr:MAG: hypothetical protein A3E47_01315 [Candidatus Peribacteria bacterium RIFCSPHIGHO2_12_FULL_54_10]